MGEAGVQHLSSGLWEERAGQCCLFAGASTGLTPALAPVPRLVSSCCPERPVPSCPHRSAVSPTVSHQGLPCCCPRTTRAGSLQAPPFSPATSHPLPSWSPQKCSPASPPLESTAGAGSAPRSDPRPPPRCLWAGQSAHMQGGGGSLRQEAFPCLAAPRPRSPWLLPITVSPQVTCGLLEAGPNADWHPRAGQAPGPEVSGYQSPTLLRATGPTISPSHSSRRLIPQGGLAPQPRPLEPRPAKKLVINQALPGRPQLLASDRCGRPLLAQPPTPTPAVLQAPRWPLAGWAGARCPS